MKEDWYLESMQKYMHQRYCKNKRIKRRLNSKQKKDRRMHQAHVYPWYPYSVKSECTLRRYASEYIPDHFEQRFQHVWDMNSRSFTRIDVGVVWVPAHNHYKLVESTQKAVTPYLQYHTQSKSKGYYKHLAERKVRRQFTTEIPLAPGHYKKVAEVEWLIW